MATRRVLVTGGCGFIGSCFIRGLLSERVEYDVVNLDALSYAGNKDNLPGVEANERYRFVHGDVRDESVVAPLVAGAEWIVNFAAESSVDRSLRGDAGAFVSTNVGGTATLLRALEQAGAGKRLLQVSTDEVYGSIPGATRVSEDAVLRPSNPYAASKAAADMLVAASHRSHGSNVVIARSSNNYGPYQYPEKLIPHFVTRALQGLSLPLYDDGSQIREWLAVEDHCRALLCLLASGESGQIYNVGSGLAPEISNRELALRIVERLDVGASCIQCVPGVRPGHDQRYALDSAKLRALGWWPSVEFDEGIASTVDWYREHRDWWGSLQGFPRTIR